MKKLISGWINEAINGRLASEFIQNRRRLNRRIITLDVYKYELTRFLQWFHLPITQLTFRKINEYIDYRMTFPKFGTEYKRLTSSVLRSFLGFVRDEYELLEYTKLTNPDLVAHDFKKQRKNPRHATTPKEMQLLIRNYKKNTDSRRLRFQRDILMLKLFLYTGMRVSELCNFQKAHIHESLRANPDQRVLYIFGKGGNERYSIINESTVQAVFDYCAEAGISDTEPIFLIEEQSVRKRLKRMSKGLVKTQKGYLTPHDFRRGFACYAYYRITNKDILRVQELLGHESLDTTQIYVKGCVRVVEEFIQTQETRLMTPSSSKTN